MTAHKTRFVITGTYDSDLREHSTSDPWEIARWVTENEDAEAMMSLAKDLRVACYPADARRLSYTADEVQHLDVHARLIFQAALDEGRAGELLATVYEGGVAYLTDDGRLGLTTDHKD